MDTVIKYGDVSKSMVVLQYSFGGTILQDRIAMLTVMVVIWHYVTMPTCFLR